MLEIVQLDGGVFQRCQSAVFDSMIIHSIIRIIILNIDLPKLKTIVYGKNALEGIKNCENKLVMKSTD